MPRVFFPAYVKNMRNITTLIRFVIAKKNKQGKKVTILRVQDGDFVIV